MSAKILIIDDHQPTRNLVSIILQQRGYRVFSAESGTEGLEQARRQEPNLILLDVMMPDMDGYEVCRHIREMDKLTDIPIIMFTAKGEADEKWEGFQAGATDYLTKPTNTDELIERVRTILERNPNLPGRTAGLTAEDVSGSDKLHNVEQPRTQLIAFVGSRGGVGTTTAAINTAYAMARTYTTLLVDLDMVQGHIGQYLNKTAGGLNNLATGSVVSIRGQLANESVSLGTNLEGLLSRPNINGSQKIFKASQVPHLVEALFHSNRQVIIDAMHGVTAYNRPLLERADHVVVCMKPERISVSSTKELLAHLEEAIMPTTELHLVMMNLGATAPPPRQAIEGFVRRKLSAVFRVSPQQVATAANKHKPLVTAHRETSLLEQFSALAQQFVPA